jgi:hypothetical protein
MDSTWTLPADRVLSGGQHFFGGGPLPICCRPPVDTVYSGRLAGRELTLSVSLPSRGVVLGEFRLVRGDTGGWGWCVCGRFWRVTTARVPSTRPVGMMPTRLTLISSGSQNLRQHVE